jgi:predicted transcriptional regulator
MAESKKQQILKVIQNMPDDVSEEDVMYAMYIRRSIELGMEDYRAGRVVSSEDVKKSIDKWRESIGQ